MNRRFIDGNCALCAFYRHFGRFGSRLLVLLFLLTRLPGQLFLPPDLMIICFCHSAMYLLGRWEARVFAPGGEDLTRPDVPRAQIRRH